MPGPHTVVFLYTDFDGGVDMWHGDSYNPRGQWFSVWHNTAANWWTGTWSFRHWSFWPSEDYELDQLTHFEREYARWSAFEWSEFLDAKGNAKGKGKHKGQRKGKGQGNARRGQRNPDLRGQFSAIPT
jgi:hypothetical protein